MEMGNLEPNGRERRRRRLSELKQLLGFDTDSSSDSMESSGSSRPSLPFSTPPADSAPSESGQPSNTETTVHMTAPMLSMTNSPAVVASQSHGLGSSIANATGFSAPLSALEPLALVFTTTRPSSTSATDLGLSASREHGPNSLPGVTNLGSAPVLSATDSLVFVTSQSHGRNTSSSAVHAKTSGQSTSNCPSLTGLSGNGVMAGLGLAPRRPTMSPHGSDQGGESWRFLEDPRLIPSLHHPSMQHQKYRLVGRSAADPDLSPPWTSTSQIANASRQRQVNPPWISASHAAYPHQSIRVNNRGVIVVREPQQMTGAKRSHPSSHDPPQTQRQPSQYPRGESQPNLTWPRLDDAAPSGDRRGQHFYQSNPLWNYQGHGQGGCSVPSGSSNQQCSFQFPIPEPRLELTAHSSDRAGYYPSTTSAYPRFEFGSSSSSPALPDGLSNQPFLFNSSVPQWELPTVQPTAHSSGQAGLYPPTTSPLPSHRFNSSSSSRYLVSPAADALIDFIQDLSRYQRAAANPVHDSEQIVSSQLNMPQDSPESSPWWDYATPARTSLIAPYASRHSQSSQPRTLNLLPEQPDLRVRVMQGSSSNPRNGGREAAERGSINKSKGIDVNLKL